MRTRLISNKYLFVLPHKNTNSIEFSKGNYKFVAFYKSVGFLLYCQIPRGHLQIKLQLFDIFKAQNILDCEREKNIYLIFTPTKPHLIVLYIPFPAVYFDFFFFVLMIFNHF